MKLAEISNEKGDTAETGAYLSEARTLTSNGIKELREAINEMKQGESYELVTKGIMQLAGQVKEMPVEVTVKGEDSDKYSHLSKMLYDCTSESITNTLKYADASKIDIILRFKENSLDLIISDNGRGCEVINDNNGLSGIRNRVNKAGGTVRFVSENGEGFLTRIHVPVKKGMN
jgi:signal transduction histidine kinase